MESSLGASAFCFTEHDAGTERIRTRSLQSHTVKQNDEAQHRLEAQRWVLQLRRECTNWLRCIARTASFPFQT